MVLHTEQRFRAVPQAFQRLVVQIDVGQVNVGRLERIRVHGEVVVMRRNLHLAGRVVAHRVVAAVMSELELVGLPAERQTEQLLELAERIGSPTQIRLGKGPSQRVSADFS